MEIIPKLIGCRKKYGKKNVPLLAGHKTNAKNPFINQTYTYCKLQYLCQYKKMMIFDYKLTTEIALLIHYKIFV